MRYTLLATPFLLSFPLLSVAEDALPYHWENTLTLENVSNLSGGIATGSRRLANLDITLAIDTNAAGWWSNGTWFAYVLGDYGKNPSDLVGDFQAISNISTSYNDIKLYEFWYQHHFAEDKFKWLVGLHDFNSTFYSLDSAGLFTNSPFGIGPDVSQVGPSIFPLTSLGSLWQYQEKNYFISFAIYDGVPGDPEHPHGTHIKLDKKDGLFKVIETGISEEKNYKLAFGLWQQTAEVNSPVDDELINNNKGYYVIGENAFTNNLTAFFQYGHADSQSNQVDQYIGAGVRYTNLCLQEDALGFAYSHVRNGEPYLQQNADALTAESVVELTYFFPVVEKVNAQTTAYYIEHPGMSSEVSNALALGLRLYVDF